jgi:hypothetical protein
MSKKKKIDFVSAEDMEGVDAGHELEVDMAAGTQAYDDEYAERIEYLKHSLWDVMGRLTQWYPRWDEWDGERLAEFRNWAAWAWHYRTEIRLLTYLARGDMDVEDRVAEWSFCTDKEFGPLPDKQALVH